VFGGMPERPNGLDSKSMRGNTHGGSNPSPSATRALLL
jgi:hypothetical protein